MLSHLFESLSRSVRFEVEALAIVPSFAGVWIEIDGDNVELDRDAQLAAQGTLEVVAVFDDFCGWA